MLCQFRLQWAPHVASTRTPAVASVADADNPHCRALAAIGRVALEVSQNRIVALWKSQARHQSLCSPSGVTDNPGQFSGPASSPAEGSCDLGEPIGESPPLTSLIPTLPSSQPDLQRHGRPLNRHILQMPDIPVMATCRRKIAVRTPSGLQPRGGDHLPSVHTIGAQDLHTRSQSPFRFCCHATSTQFAFCRSSQFRLTQSEEDPRACRLWREISSAARAAFRPAWRSAVNSLVAKSLGRSSHAEGQSGDGERQSTTTAPAQARPAYAAPPPDLSTNPAFAQSPIKPQSFCRSRLDIGLEDLSVHRRVDNEGRGEAITAQSGDESLRLSVSERPFERSRWPFRQPPRRRVILVVVQVSSRKTNRCGSSYVSWVLTLDMPTVNVRLNRETALACDLS